MGEEFDRSAVPRLVMWALYLILIVAAVSSLPFIGQYGPLPTTALLDAWIILFVAACIIRGRTETVPLLLFLGGYLLTRIIPALVTGSPLEDFAQAYRWILYLIAFAFAVGRQWLPLQPLIRVMWALLFMAFGKAAATFVLLGPGERPGLLLENNFELALFSGLIAVLYRHLGRAGWLAIIVLGLHTVLSGSRSGAVAFLILALYAISQVKLTRRNMFGQFLAVCAIPVLVLIPVWVFSSRIESVQIDRLNFLNVFLNETRDWNLWNWLFGTVPITPLSDGCLQLSFYQALFSSVGDGSCYSVILHAFLMRVIFDAGLFGAVLAFGVAWYAMRRAGTHWKLAACLILIAGANSLSVSGLNNPYVALPILLAIATAGSTLRTSPGNWNEREVSAVPDARADVESEAQESTARRER